MTNHYHVVVETPEANLSEGMRQLNGVFTQITNRRHGLVGHLFQGRFKGILVELDAYLLELARYVELNPVRAGMVLEPGDWTWSSYRAMVGQEAAPVWLENESAARPIRWGALGSTSLLRAVRSRRDRPGNRLGEGLRHQVFLGSEAFAARQRGATKPVEELREVPRAQRPPLGQTTRPFCPPLPRPSRSDGIGFPHWRLDHAGDCRLLRRPLREGHPRPATT